MYNLMIIIVSIFYLVTSLYIWFTRNKKTYKIQSIKLILIMISFSIFIISVIDLALK